MTRYVRMPHSFRTDERGNVAIIFALTSVIAVSIVGGAVDFGRVFQMKYEMQQTLDAAALAGASHYAQTNDLDAARGLTLKFFQERYGRNQSRARTTPTIEIVGSNALITAKATVDVPTPFLSFMISDTIPVETWTSTSLGGKKLEIALMFDVTGSMEDPTAGGTSSKIVDAKTAAKDLIDIVLPESGAYATKMSLVPFSQRVKLDAATASAVTGQPATKDIYRNVNRTVNDYSLSTTEFSWRSLTSCIDRLSKNYYEKLGQSPSVADANADAYCRTLQTRTQGKSLQYYTPAVITTSRTVTEQQFVRTDYINPCFIERSTTVSSRIASDEAPLTGEWTAAYSSTQTEDVSCPPNGDNGRGTLIPLTANRDALRSAIENLQTGGATAGHIGTAWSLYAISPKWANHVWTGESRPSDSDDPNVMKAAVLMTDGAYNSCGGGSSNCSTSDEQALALCTKMKNEYGITVYTIGFGMSTNVNDPARQTLVNCASPGKYYFPYNGDELRTAFSDIGAALVSGGAGPRLLPKDMIVLDQPSQ